MSRVKVSEEHFVIAYEGPALEDHTMNARDLATSVLALSEAFHRAQKILGPETSPASLNIKAFNEGSFEVAMVLVEGARDFLLGSLVQSTVTLTTLVGTVWASVAWVKQARGRRIAKAEPATPGEVMVTFDDDTHMSIPTEQFQLVKDVTFRKQVTETLKPLDGENVTNFRVTDTSLRLNVSAEEVAYFVPSEEVQVEELDPVERITTLQPLGVAFDGRKWRFTEGGAQFTASIDDEIFKGKVERQEVVFGSNDLLQVRLRVEQFRDTNGSLKANHSIVEVIKHIDGGQQLGFDMRGLV